MEAIKMKKIYQSPIVNKVIYGSDIMETEMQPSSVGVKAGVSGQSDGQFEFWGDGGKNQRVDAKTNGRGFWDDED